MDKEILFKETQRFKQWWLWLLLIGIDFRLLVGVYYQIFLGQPFGNKPMSNEGLVFVTAFLILFSLVFFTFQLETIIKKAGIYVRFFPFHFRFKFYSWDSISKIYVRKYSPVLEYGGWGLRLGLFGKGKAYNVSGNKGLQLVFNNNKKLLIGTGKPQELTEVLTKLGQLKQ